MTSRNNCEVSAQPGPRKPSSDSDRARKRDRSVLTTTVGGSVCRDRSKSVSIDFKKPRLQPVGGSGRRDQSKSLTRNFKKPCLPKRRLRAKKVPSRGAAPPAAEHRSDSTPLTFRGRKCDRSVLTTPVGGSVCRDQSKSLIITFKKPRLPKRQLRAKKVPSKGAAPPAANVTTPTSSLAPPTPSMAPPTPSSAPPTPSLAPPTYPMTPPTPSLTPPTPSSAPPTPLIPPTPPLAPPAPSLAPPTPSLDPPTPSLAPPSITEVWREAMWIEEIDHFSCCTCPDFSPLFFDWDLPLYTLDFLSWDERKVKQRIVQLLRRDERSRQQGSEEHLQKQQDLSSLFRDMEESGVLRRDERSRQQDSEEHLQKQQDLNSLFRDMEESGELRRSFPERLESLQKAWRLRRYFTLWKLHGRSSENFILMGGSADQKTEDPTGVSSLYHTGRFCQSSSGKTRRSLSVRNTRKYLRRVHTRTAGGALRRVPQPDCKLESRLSGSQ